MTRIVSGTHRGRLLAVPPGTGTRPTADRAREGMFSSLDSLLGVAGARLLDLYAGTGAAAFEALSRGAAAAVLVEHDPAALAAIQQSAARLGLAPEVHATSVASFLLGTPAPYDIVVLDPPYDTPVDEALAGVVPWLAPDAVVAVERSSRGPALRWPPGVRAVRERRYGEATLWYGRRT